MSTKPTTPQKIIFIALVVASCVMVLAWLFNKKDIGKSNPINLDPYKKELIELDSKIEMKKNSEDYSELKKDVETAAFLVGELSKGIIKEDKVEEEKNKIENIIKSLKEQLE